MSQEVILYPALLLGFWTFCILIMIPFKRSRARARGEVTTDDFALGESSNVPADVSLVNRNYMNLLEMPILFYVACLMFYVTGGATIASLIMSWLFVATRVAHSVVHISYNNVIHRRGIFTISNIVLMALWVILAVNTF